MPDDQPEPSPAPPDVAGPPRNDRAAYVLVALCAVFLLITFFSYAGR
jgi:hypothetical protein